MRQWCEWEWPWCQYHWLENRTTSVSLFINPPPPFQSLHHDIPLTPLTTPSHPTMDTDHTNITNTCSLSQSVSEQQALTGRLPVVERGGSVTLGLVGAGVVGRVGRVGIIGARGGHQHRVMGNRGTNKKDHRKQTRLRLHITKKTTGAFGR